MKRFRLTSALLVLFVLPGCDLLLVNRPPEPPAVTMRRELNASMSAVRHTRAAVYEMFTNGLLNSNETRNININLTAARNQLELANLALAKGEMATADDFLRAAEGVLNSVRLQIGEAH